MERSVVEPRFLFHTSFPESTVGLGCGPRLGKAEEQTAPALFLNLVPKTSQYAQFEFKVLILESRWPILS